MESLRTLFGGISSLVRIFSVPSLRWMASKPGSFRPPLQGTDYTCPRTRVNLGTVTLALIATSLATCDTGPIPLATSETSSCRSRDGLYDRSMRAVGRCDAPPRHLFLSQRQCLRDGTSTAERKRTSGSSWARASHPRPRGVARGTRGLRPLRGGGQGRSFRRSRRATAGRRRPPWRGLDHGGATT